MDDKIVNIKEVLNQRNSDNTNNIKEHTWYNINENIDKILNIDIKKIWLSIWLVTTIEEFKSAVNELNLDNINELQKNEIAKFLIKNGCFLNLVIFCDYFNYDFKNIWPQYFIDGFKKVLAEKNLSDYYEDLFWEIIFNEGDLKSWIVFTFLDKFDESNLYKEYRLQLISKKIFSNLECFKNKIIIENKTFSSKQDAVKSEFKIKTNFLNSNLENTPFITFFIWEDKKYKMIIFQEKQLLKSVINDENIEVFSDKKAYLERFDEINNKYLTKLDNNNFYGVACLKINWIPRNNNIFDITKKLTISSNQEYYSEKKAA